MDVLGETSLIVRVLNPTQTPVPEQAGSRELRGNLKSYDAANTSSLSITSSPSSSSSSSATLSSAKGPPDRCLAFKRPADAPAVQATSATTCSPENVSSWLFPEGSCPPPLSMMEPVGMPALGDDNLLQQSRTSCLGPFADTKDLADPQPGLGLKMADMGQEYEPCSIADMGIQGMSTGEAVSIGYGHQLLSDQLLGFPEPKSQPGDKREGEKLDSDSDDPASKNLYEGLLLDKCNGEEALMSSSNQDWGYFESFISESKIELLDLCSKNELSVNLFSEEDVDNYMFDDDDDDSTLSSDMCSLKIRYESFQDNVREKTNVLQEETQFSFFPSVLVNSTKKDSGVVKRADESEPKVEELVLPEIKTRVAEQDDSSSDQSPDYSPKMNYFMDFSSSAGDSGEYSDDSSSAGSSSHTFQESRHRNAFSRKHASSPTLLNYGLRAKRKVRYSEDYLYDVDSIDSEKNTEKRERPPAGPRKEKDDDWCPKKRRKSPRKETPMIIKYIIINRFKGEKQMAVKLGRIDPTVTTVSLNEGTMCAYEKLAPLKGFWQAKQREREEQLKLAAGDKRNFHLNGRHRLFSSRSPKRRYKLANRLRIHRIQTVEQSPNKQALSPSDLWLEGATNNEPSPTGKPLMSGAPCSDSTSHITHTATQVKSRSQERQERRMGDKVVRIRKFRSEARLRSRTLRELEEGGESMTKLMEVCTLMKTKDSAETDVNAGVNSVGVSPHLHESHTSTDTAETFAFMPATCTTNKALSSEDTNVPVIPGGYLQTLLDASDSSSNAAIPFFPQQVPRQFPLGLSLEEKQFASLQLAQSCVLSPPSESELQQSPQNCTNFPQIWPSHLCPNQQYPADIPETAILPSAFSGSVPVPAHDGMAAAAYSQLGLERNGMMYEKSYMPEQPLPPEGEFLPCQGPCVDGQLPFQRGMLQSDSGRLVSFDSAGSLSAASSNYSSLSLKSCEKEGEDDGNENFLAHCSPKVVIQQSIDAITPLRESTDLLDISNFTPDKFRHSSLCELSPPETPNLSPQVLGREMNAAGKASDPQDGVEMTMGGAVGMKWNCNLLEHQERQAGYAVESHQLQLHPVKDSGSGLGNSVTNVMEFDEQAGEMICVVKGAKPKRKNSTKQGLGQGTRKSRTPRAPKAEKGKSPRQDSRASKKIKALLEGRAGKGQAGNLTFPSKQVADGPEDWPSMGWSDTNGRADDDQREFEEPSNILSNIVSGMAEVQRFMMASVEPIWGPAADLCLPSEVNSLKLKTLKILAGTPPEPRKKGATSTGMGRGRKAGGKGAKNQAKFPPPHSFLPQLGLGCSVFDRPNLGVPGLNGPAHKKMYRHKTSSKFPRIENLKGKRAERVDQNKDIALMASFEKLR